MEDKERWRTRSDGGQGEKEDKNRWMTRREGGQREMDDKKKKDKEIRRTESDGGHTVLSRFYFIFVPRKVYAN